MTGADLLALIKKQPIASICVLIALAAGVAFYFRADAVDTARTAFDEKEKEARRIEANARALTGLPEETAQMQEAGRQFDARLVRASQLANNYQFFYRLETETGVKLLDVRQNAIPPARPNTPRGAYVGVPFAVSVQGNFAQVLDFLRRVEAGPHFVRFNQVTFNKLDAAAASGRADSGAGVEALSVSLLLDMLGTP